MKFQGLVSTGNSTGLSVMLPLRVECAICAYDAQATGGRDRSRAGCTGVRTRAGSRDGITATGM